MLLSLKRALAGSSATRSPRSMPSQPRQGAVLGVVTTVVGLAKNPMRVCEIHGAVEQLLGRTVPYSTVRDALCAHLHGRDQRFRRAGWGQYQLLNYTGTSKRELVDPDPAA
jgi:hypothetical protein